MFRYLAITLFRKVNVLINKFSSFWAHFDLSRWLNLKKSLINFININILQELLLFLKGNIISKKSSAFAVVLLTSKASSIFHFYWPFSGKVFRKSPVMLIHTMLNICIDIFAVITIPLYIYFLVIEVKIMISNKKNMLTAGFTITVLSIGKESAQD